MCWRGHGPEFRRSDRGCARCHMLRTRAYRSGYPSRHRPLFSLNHEFYKRLKRRYRWTDLTISVFTGISRYALIDYKRGMHGGRAIRATRERAAAISQAMRCDFNQLWMEA